VEMDIPRHARRQPAVSCAKTAEPIELSLVLWPKEACATWDAHWRHLANTTEPSICGGDAVFLSNYFDHVLLIFIVCVLQSVKLVSALPRGDKKESEQF